MIELDVRQTKDKELVVIHDVLLERTTNGSGFVFNKTLAEIKELDAGKGKKFQRLRKYYHLLKVK